jgi:hypothetical protein
MKKTVKIEMYLDCTNEWGDRRWNYVCSVWGDHIEFDSSSWYLRDAENRLVCCGNLSELHGAGSYEFGVKFMNVVCY